MRADTLEPRLHTGQRSEMFCLFLPRNLCQVEVQQFVSIVSCKTRPCSPNHFQYKARWSSSKTCHGSHHLVEIFQPCRNRYLVVLQDPTVSEKCLGCLLQVMLHHDAIWSLVPSIYNLTTFDQSCCAGAPRRTTPGTADTYQFAAGSGDRRNPSNSARPNSETTSPPNSIAHQLTGIPTPGTNPPQPARSSRSPSHSQTGQCAWPVWSDGRTLQSSVRRRRRAFPFHSHSRTACARAGAGRRHGNPVYGTSHSTVSNLTEESGASLQGKSYDDSPAECSPDSTRRSLTLPPGLSNMHYAPEQARIAWRPSFAQLLSWMSLPRSCPFMGGQPMTRYRGSHVPQNYSR